jgi:hypothetical protein
LTNSEIADQLEQLKITPDDMALEERSKLWAAFQAKYRTTAAYVVTVVIIDSTHSARAALPVSGRVARAVPFEHPFIERIVSESGESAAIVPGTNALVEGRSLASTHMKLFVGDLDMTSAVKESSGSSIKFEVAASPPAGLYAGLHPVRVTHDVLLGAPQTFHKGMESNVQAMVLRPAVSVPAAATVASSVVENSVTYKTGTVAVQFNPKVAKHQRVTLLLNEHGRHHQHRHTVPKGRRRYLPGAGANRRRRECVGVRGRRIRFTQDHSVRLWKLVRTYPRYATVSATPSAPSSTVSTLCWRGSSAKRRSRTMA